MLDEQHIQKIMARYAGLGLLQRALLKTRFMSLPLVELDAALPEDAVIAEPGCGHGVLAHYLKLRAPQRQITGCDISAARIATAQKSAEDIPGLTFFIRDATEPGALDSLRADDTPLHVIVSQLIYLFSHEQALAFLRDIRGQMQPDDILWLIDYTTTPLFPYIWLRSQNALLTAASRISVLLASDGLSQAFGSRSRLARIPTPTAWQRLLAEAGFVSERIPCAPLTFVPIIMFRSVSPATSSA